eukprot:CAMPEP_0170549846 /NCGR_PEP_ID=MMETSP0211-20121228/7972_1 /TAXON_ID=311385 /ORGANISM="Pseudokeronopsis sp., Strain OXSARD2" /LENGTH=53 /DNA_ID=CAMNT_0010856091 /DNA_START=1734 /DNA_END=1895 /DNA_ORIENTATION=-
MKKQINAYRKEIINLSTCKKGILKEKVKEEKSPEKMDMSEDQNSQTLKNKSYQ